MREPVWVGIDVGTQSARVLAVDARGRLRGAGTAALQSTRDGSTHVQDPEAWWSAVCQASRDALRGKPELRVGALAVDATSGTILLANRSGTPLTAGLMYDDGRAGAEAEDVNAVGAATWATLGYQQVQPSWALPKLLWLLRNVPETAVEARLLHQADFITWRLAGRQLPADASHALKTGYHLIDDRWPTEVFEPLGIPEHLLPRVVTPGSILGEVGTDGARETGIPVGTPIVAGMTDGCAAQLGAGALRVGSWNSVLGTTLVLKGVADRLVRDPNGVVYCHRGPDGTWFPGGASSSGAGVISAQFRGTDLDALTAAAAALPPGPVAYPITSPGERFPFSAPSAEPFMLGEPIGEAGVFAAVLLGLACVERLCFDYLDLLGAPIDGPLSLTGGGAKNRYWCQLRADLLERPVTVPVQAEAGLGMAVLAAAGAQNLPLSQAAVVMVRPGHHLEPDPARSGDLLDIYQRFLDELTDRGWLADAVADHAHGRAGQ